MGESSGCLVRSVSQPYPTSSESNEGDPLRCLTTSVSFGRFMTESLDWEKWSSFTKNRHLEEVKKYFKPGTVAQKKAYFEAHYKKIAAKKAAASLEEDDEEANDSFKLSFTNEICNDSSMDIELAVSNTHMAIDEKQGLEEGHVSELAGSTEINELDTITQVEGAELVIEQDVFIENPIQVELSNLPENVENQSKTMSIQEEKTPITVKDAENKRNLASPSKKRPAGSFSKSSTDNGSSKRRAPAKLTIPVPPKKEDNYTSNSKKTARVPMEKKRPDPKSLHMSINFAPRASETVKTSSPIIRKIGNSGIVKTIAKASKDSWIQRPSTRSSVNVSKNSILTPQLENKRSINFALRASETVKTSSPILQNIGNSGIVKTIVKASKDSWIQRTSTRLSVNVSKNSTLTPQLENKRKEDNYTPKNKKTKRVSMEKRRPAPKSLHMSINSAPHASETVKTSSPILQKIGSSGIVKTIVKASKDSKIQRTSTRSSVNVSKSSTLTPQLENKRSRTLLNTAISEIKTVDGKSRPLSTDHLESSSVCGRKTRSPLVSSSFTLRSEERAAKRKEFFQKLEEKRNNKEAEKIQLQAKSKALRM